jgi:hypothetical protein
MEPAEGVALKSFRFKLPEIMVVPLAENAGANTSASVTERANKLIPRPALQQFAERILAFIVKLG